MPGPTPHAHLGETELGSGPILGYSHARCSCLRTRVPWWRMALGNRGSCNTCWMGIGYHGVQLPLGAFVSGTGEGRRSLRDGRGRWGAHLSLSEGADSLQPAGSPQPDGRSSPRRSRQEWTGRSPHGAHLPALQYDGHHKAHDACRGQEVAWTWPHPYSPGRGPGKFRRSLVAEVYGRSSALGTGEMGRDRA